MSRLHEHLNAHPVLTRTVVGYFIRADEVLLGLRKHTETGLGQNIIAGIGGKVGDLAGLEHETPEEAMAREAQEEIGITPTAYTAFGNVIYLIPHKPKWSQQVTIFLIEAWTGEPKETSAIRPLWFKQHKLPEAQMWPDNLLTIPYILARKTIRGTFLYNEQGIEEYELEEVERYRNQPK